MRLGLRQISIDAMLTFGRQFLAGLLQLGIVLLIGRMLGPEGTGTYALALLLPTLLSSLLNLGMATSNVYFLASRQFELRQVWTTTRNMGLILGVVGLILGVVIVVFAAELAFPQIDQNLLLLSMLIFPFSLISGQISGIFQALQDFRSYNLLVLAQPVLALSLLASLWSLDAFALPAVLAATIIAHAGALCVGLVFLARRVAVFCPTVGMLAYLRPAVRYGIQAHLSNLVAFLNYRLDLFLVNLFLGTAAAGLYTIAVRLVEQLWIISQAVSTVLFPKLSSLIGDERGRTALTPLIARLVLWLTLLIAGVLAAIAEPLIVALFGAAFAGAVPALLVLLPGIVLLSCSRILASDLAARRLVHINMFLAVGILVVNTAGNLLLIPIFGIVGAALATSLAYAINLLTRLVIQWQVTQVSWWLILIPQPEDFRRLAQALKLQREPS